MSFGFTGRRFRPPFLSAPTVRVGSGSALFATRIGRGRPNTIMDKEKILDIAVPVFVFGVYVPAVIVTTCILGVFHLGSKLIRHP